VITVGSEYNISTQMYYEWDIKCLSATSFLVVYSAYINSAMKGVGRIGTVSGDVVTFGTQTIINSEGGSGYQSITAMSATKVIISFADYYNSTTYGKSIICLIDSTTITPDTKYTFNSAGTYPIFSTPLSSSSFVVIYRDYGNSSYGTAIVGTIPIEGKKINGVTNVKWNGLTITKWNGQ